MSNQPEALRLADALESCSLHVGDPEQAQAAAELRRLHAENEALQKTKHYEASLWRLRRINADLLEALKAAEPYLRHADVAYNVYVQARAAIAKAEGQA